MSVALRNAIEELASRVQRGQGINALLGTLFSKQREVLGCTARRVAALCTRRAGKTTMVPAALLRAAEENPGCVVLFLGRTRMRAKQLAWKNLLNDVAVFGLQYRANIAELTLSHPSNGAEIRLYGATDTNVADRVRGDKLAFVIIDEAQMIPDDVLKMLVDDVLWPALLDVSGCLLLLGTPGRQFEGLWYEITKNEEDERRSERARGWIVFEWSGLDNPSLNHKGQKIAELFGSELASLEADPAKGPRHPTVVREYRGRWCEGTEDLYYSFAKERNTWIGGALPSGHTWRHGMGVDLGKVAFAIEVLAYSETSTAIYEVDGIKVRGVNANQWKALTKEWLARFQPDFCVVDYGGLGIATVEGWQEDGMAVEAAEKGSREAYVAMLNADLEAGLFKALEGRALAKEMGNLPVDPETPPGKPPKPAEGYEDHSSDAGLYAWRKAYRLCGREDAPRVESTPDEVDRSWMQRQKEEFLNQQRRRSAGGLF